MAPATVGPVTFWRGLIASAAVGELELAGVDRDVADEVVTAALAHHDQPHRQHHTVRHLGEMQREVQRLRPYSTVDDLDPSVTLAVLWHDAVYDPTASDNETASAALARTALSGVVPAELVDRTARLVAFTADHTQVADDPGEQLLHDADLWILSASEARYDEYRAQVRAEYAHLNDSQWHEGRAAVLSRLHDHLSTRGYQVGPDVDRARRTARALANLSREHTTLH